MTSRVVGLARTSLQRTTVMLIAYSSLLIFSTTINFSIFAFFFVCPIVKQCFRKSTCAVSERATRLFDDKPAIACRFFRDQVFCAVIFACGIIFLGTTDVLHKPFLNTPEHVLAVFAFNLGHYVYRFFQDILLRKFIPLFKINLLHHMVTIGTYTVFLWYKQNAISGIIGLLFEGSSIVFEVGGFLKALGISKNSFIYISLMATGFILTVVFRGVCPLIMLILVTFNENPLKMDYVPLGFFFMNIVFFSMVNGWLMKTSLLGLRRRLLSRRIINELQRYRVVRNGSQNHEIFPLNNLGDSRRAQHQPITVVIPADNNFRLARPVSNFNMDYSRTLVSNITLSRHERTLPNFNIIVNQNPPAGSSREATSTLSTEV